jgi:hypothetical protein
MTDHSDLDHQRMFEEMAPENRSPTIPDPTPALARWWELLSI